MNEETHAGLARPVSTAGASRTLALMAAAASGLLIAAAAVGPLVAVPGRAEARSGSPDGADMAAPIPATTSGGLDALGVDSAGAGLVALPTGTAGKLALAATVPALADGMAATGGDAEAAAPATTGVIRPAAITSPLVSGLTWRSGARAESNFGSWRGRRIDVALTFVQHASWDQMADQLDGKYFRTRATAGPQAVVSLAMLTRATRGQHAACAQGAFDKYFRQFGQLLVRAGVGRAAVRLGWEANTGPSSHEWGVSSKAQIPAYIACFRREAQALKSVAPGLQIEWSNAKQGKQEFSVLEMYPGDAYVDHWGVHYYDSGPRKTTQKIWDEYYKKTNHGGPWGLGTWIAAARSHGKKLGVPEWALWANGMDGSPDNPVYIENMYKTFKANASSIAYETYFNSGSQHAIGPKTRFPKASARYQQLWSSGK